MHNVAPLADLRHVIDITAARNLRIAAGLLGAVASVLEGAATVFEDDYGPRHELVALLNLGHPGPMRPPEPVHRPRPIGQAGPPGSVHAAGGSHVAASDGRRLRGDPPVRPHLVPVPRPRAADTRWPHPVRGPRRPPV